MCSLSLYVEKQPDYGFLQETYLIFTFQKTTF